jgi:hypothetical protein
MSGGKWEGYGTVQESKLWIRSCGSHAAAFRDLLQAVYEHTRRVNNTGLTGKLQRLYWTWSLNLNNTYIFVHLVQVCTNDIRIKMFSVLLSKPAVTLLWCGGEIWRISRNHDNLILKTYNNVSANFDFGPNRRTVGKLFSVRMWVTRNMPHYKDEWRLNWNMKGKTEYI